MPLGSLITYLFTFVYLHLCCLCGPYQNNNKPSLLLFWSRPHRQHKCKQTNVNKDGIKLPNRVNSGQHLLWLCHKMTFYLRYCNWPFRNEICSASVIIIGRPIMRYIVISASVIIIFLLLLILLLLFQIGEKWKSLRLSNRYGTERPHNWPLLMKYVGAIITTNSPQKLRIINIITHHQ